MNKTISTNKSICLAVLPFENLTGNSGNDYLSRGFAEDIITDLSRFPSLQIISSNSSMSKEIGADKDSAEKLGADYFLKGSLRMIGTNLRIGAQLVDPFTNAILWAERYDAEIKKIFEIHDEIIEKVVSSLSIHIDVTRLTDARKKDLTQLEAYECWLRGYEYIRKGTIKDDESAREFFNRALDIDPHYARAFAGLSISHFNEWTCQYWDRWDASLDAAQDYAAKAIQLNAADHVSQFILGRVLLYRRDFDSAETHINNSLELNGNDADILVQIGHSKALLGDPKAGLDLVRKGSRLNPFHPLWYELFAAYVYFIGEDYDSAIASAEKIPPMMWVDLPAYTAAAYAYKSDFEKAAYYLDLFLKNFIAKISYGREPNPGEAFDWIVATNPFRNKKDLERLIKGLELAGLTKEATRSDSGYLPAHQTFASPNKFKKEKNLWILSFNNTSVQLPEVKGFLDIAKLLANPEQDFHCSELMGNVSSLNDGVDAIDEKAKRKYRARIEELQEEIVVAEEMNDIGRAESLNLELNQIIDHLERSTGLKGRSRKLADPSERARAAVTLRIRSAIQKIEIAHPSLAKHFQNTLKTGTYCRYSPENRINWDL